MHTTHRRQNNSCSDVTSPRGSKCYALPRSLGGWPLSGKPWGTGIALGGFGGHRVKSSHPCIMGHNSWHVGSGEPRRPSGGIKCVTAGQVLMSLLLQCKHLHLCPRGAARRVRPLITLPKAACITSLKMTKFMVLKESYISQKIKHGNKKSQRKR